MGDRDPDLLQRNSGIQQTLDDLEDENIAESVQPLGARTGGRRTVGCTSPVRAQ